MAATVTALVMVVVLVVWHRHTRRHPAWTLSSDARFYLRAGYPMLAIGVFWLVESPSDSDWEWIVGNVWGVAAMVMFVLGFRALGAVLHRHHEVSQAIETIPQPSGTQGLTTLS